MPHPPSEPPVFRARVVKDGNSVAIRLPASLGLKPGEEVDLAIRRVCDWPAGYFELEANSAFPMPERAKGKHHDDRK